MKKRLFHVLVTLVMLVGLMAVMTVTASAAETTYDLSIGGVPVTDANKDNIVVPGATGSATFDPATSTLTLDDFSCSSNDAFGGVIHVNSGDITIKLKGNNTLTGTGEDTAGISSNGNLVICNGEEGAAQGQLTINTEVKACVNAVSGTLKITGVKVTATSKKNYGLSAESISLSGVTLSATGFWEPIYTGSFYQMDPETNMPVEVYGAINIENSTVEAYCTGEYYAFKSAPTITGGYAVYAGNDATSAAKVASPTDATYITSKYVKIVPTYPVWVGGEQFTGTNLVIDGEDVTGITGSATFDPSTNTLTLDNFSYTGEGTYCFEDEEETYGVIAARFDLTIKLRGDNFITCTGGTGGNHAGIAASGHLVICDDLNASGMGELTVIGEYGIVGYGSEFSAQNCVVKVTAEKTAIYAFDSAYIKTRTFIAKGGNSAFSTSSDEVISTHAENSHVFAGENESAAEAADPVANPAVRDNIFTSKYVRIVSYHTITTPTTTGGTVTGGGTYQVGATVTLTATPNSGYNFVNWTKNGSVVSTDATYTFTAIESAEYVANFQARYVEIPERSRVSFVADGRLVGIILYRPSQDELTFIPKVPAKEGYVGTWETYTLNGKNMVVRAVYTKE